MTSFKQVNNKIKIFLKPLFVVAFLIIRRYLKITKENVNRFISIESKGQATFTEENIATNNIKC